MAESNFKNLFKSGLVIFSVLFLVGFDFPKVKNVNIKDKAKIKQGQQTPAPTTDVILTDVPAGGAFKGFYYVEPVVWGDTIYLAVVKRKILSANFMNSCDYVLYEGDPSDAFGPEVGDFIKSKRDWAPISGSISAISKGHLDICRDLFNQPTVSDMCASGNLGIGMSVGKSGGLGGYNFPNALGGGGGGRRGAERLGDQSFGQQRLGERLSGQTGAGGRPSFGGPEFGVGGDGGAGSFLWSYDPCSNQNCATSGGGQKGFSGLGSSISGFGSRTLYLPGEGKGGSGSGGLGGGDPRMMEGSGEPRATGIGTGITYGGGHEIEVAFSWGVGINSGDLNFLVSYRDLKTGEHLGHRSGGCNVGGDPNCAAAAAAMAAAVQPGSTPAQVGSASAAIKPYIVD